METQGKTNYKFEVVLRQVMEENKDIKILIIKLTNTLIIQKRGKFPSQP